MDSEVNLGRSNYVRREGVKLGYFVRDAAVGVRFSLFLQCSRIACIIPARPTNSVVFAPDIHGWIKPFSQTVHCGTTSTSLAKSITCSLAHAGLSACQISTSTTPNEVARINARAESRFHLRRNRRMYFRRKR
jgi:hypothetical protein